MSITARKLTDANATEFLDEFRQLYLEQQQKPTAKRAAKLEALNRQWQKSDGGDAAEIFEITIGSG